MSHPSCVVHFVSTLLLCCLVTRGLEAARLRRVIGGEQAKATEFYYQASLRVEGLHRCGGAVISDRHILTAAHCIVGLIDPPYDELTVATGSTELQGGKSHDVFNVSWPTDFKRGAHDTYFNDIAVITLKNRIHFNEDANVVLLPSSPALENQTGVISGFGRTNALNPYNSKTLMKFSAKVMSKDRCQKYMKHEIYNGQMCGVAAKGVGFCQGDSGGPFVVNNVIVGTVSWNIPCATGVPDVYTDVYEYVDFIRKAMNGK